MNEQGVCILLLKWPVCTYTNYLSGSAKSLSQLCVTESFSILYKFPQHHPSIIAWQHLNYSGLDVQMTKVIWIDLCYFLFSGRSGLVGITIPHLQMSLSKSILVWFFYAFPFTSKCWYLNGLYMCKWYWTILDKPFVAEFKIYPFRVPS